MIDRSHSMKPEIVIDRNGILESLRRSNPHGGTDLLAALASAMAATGRAVAEASHHVIIITDGEVPARSLEETIAALPVPIVVGVGISEPTSPEMSWEQLKTEALLRDPELWGGLLLGPKQAAQRLGISRSTLDVWRRSGFILSLPKGRTGHVIPMLQFEGSQPIAGLGQVMQAAGASKPGPRMAVVWRWLTLPQSDFERHPPLDALRQGRIEEVVAAAERSLGGM